MILGKKHRIYDHCNPASTRLGMVFDRSHSICLISHSTSWFIFVVIVRGGGTAFVIAVIVVLLFPANRNARSGWILPPQTLPLPLFETQLLVELYVVGGSSSVVAFALLFPAKRIARLGSISSPLSSLFSWVVVAVVSITAVLFLPNSIVKFGLLPRRNYLYCHKHHSRPILLYDSNIKASYVCQWQRRWTIRVLLNVTIVIMIIIVIGFAATAWSEIIK